jgi:flagellar biosynthesis protein FlhF
MQVKTFEALSVKDAVKAVKREFGSDAVILSTREKISEGPEKLKMVEVTAAIPQSERTFGGASRAVSTENTNDARLAVLELKLQQLADNSATRSQYHSLETGLSELKSLLLESLRGKDGSPLQNLPESLISLDRTLRANGVSDTNIAGLIKHLRTLAIDSDQARAGGTALEDFYKTNAMRWMLKRIKIAPRWTLSPGSAAVQAFVGPPGCGKTSMVAKIAAQYHIREKAKVLVVSCDNSRLAAPEQLRVYCKIVGVPFVAISTPTELSNVVLAQRDTSLVLVDTPGISTKAAPSINELQGLRSQNLGVDMHLVCSATEKQEQIERGVRAWSSLAIQSLAFSKLDESWSFGEIFNVSSKWSIPLSFFSTGQAIPEDLERATRERVVERIFGL